ncbi:hypothetical protein M2132_001548 [Dysgonomonas sp. PH5-45]|uniref:hypothetical protein n=1 Tax=unclassified Dysgonomonas TaxID=2630389 RepID=UPI002472F1D1|nr:MULTISPECIES: hypothetical protein [unclassified Dysgonomonas]MDH6355211.1 hypothetical protein [Dysgonomonas sp. PH5-45]MDH6388063.1 hypothetical protein [Dysgonomonas sp. PH5-37]
MKKFILTLLIPLTISTILLAQEKPLFLNVEWTDKKTPGQKGKRIKDCVYLTGDDNVIFYLYQTGIPPERQNTGDYIVKHNLKDGKMEYFKIELNNIKKVDRNYEGAKVINGDIYLFSSFKNKKDKKYYFFAETVKKEPFSLNRDERMIGEIDYSKIKGGKLSNMSFVTSPDESKILISYSLLNKKNEILSFGLEVFDNKLTSIWKRANDFPTLTKDEKVYLGQYVVDNNANAYLTSHVYKKKGKDKKLFLTHYPGDGSDAGIKEITFSGQNYALSQHLGINNNNDLICAGFFSRIGNKSAIGSFSIILPSGSIKDFRMNEKLFDNNYLTKGMNEKEAEKTLEKKDKNKDFDDGYYYKFEDIHFKNDGGFYISAEKRAITLIEKRQQGVVFKYNIYHYSDISLLNFDKNGNLLWAYKIPKNQNLQNEDRNRASYALGFDQNDAAYIIYNTVKMFLGKAKSGSIQTILIKLGNDGTESWNELFTDNNDVTKSFSPRNTRSLGDGKFLLNRTHYGGFMSGPSIQWGIVNLQK